MQISMGPRWNLGRLPFVTVSRGLGSHFAWYTATCFHRHLQADLFNWMITKAYLLLARRSVSAQHKETQAYVQSHGKEKENFLILSLMLMLSSGPFSRWDISALVLCAYARVCACVACENQALWPNCSSPRPPTGSSVWSETALNSAALSRSFCGVADQADQFWHMVSAHIVYILDF